MFALKPWTELIARVSLIAVILFNALVPTTASASSLPENIASIKKADDIASSITLGSPESDIQEQVPLLSEQIAKRAQQQQAEKPARFKASAEPAIYTPGQPISLQWKVQDIKSEGLANASVIIHTPAGFTPTDPNPSYTPDGLVTIPLSSKKESSEWNVPTNAELPIYFGLDLLANDKLIASETVLVDQARFSVEKNVGGNLRQ